MNYSNDIDFYEKLNKVQELLHECSVNEHAVTTKLKSREFTIEILNHQLIEAHIERVQLLEIINKLRNNE
jgi:hypothetical protein